MATFTSSDGTAIAASVGGSGPSVVLVHGTTGSDFSWALVRPHLEDRYRVYAVQRRGRGASGDGTDYSLEREAEDIAAVVNSIGKPVVLVGHSHGATCCLEASLRTAHIRRLVLYEPVFSWPVDEALLAEVDELVVAGQGEAATGTYLRKAVGLPEDEIDLLRSLPTWAVRVAAAHTLTREDRADAAYRLEPERFGGMTVPTLVLTGSASPADFRRWADEALTALLSGTIHVLEGQGHAANVTAPELLAAEIAAFAEAS